MSLLVETIQIPINTNNVQSTTQIQSDKVYRVVLRGLADCQTEKAAPWGDHDGIWWTINSDGDKVLGADGSVPNGGVVYLAWNGAPFPEMPYDENHRYVRENVEGTGTQWTFSWVDPKLSNNSGSLYIDIYEYTGADHTETDCAWGTHAGGSVESEDPISLQDGDKRERVTDMTLNSPGTTLTFTRSYRQSQQTNSIVDTRLGLGWTHNHKSFIDNSISGILRVYMQRGGYSEYAQDSSDPNLYLGKAGSTAHITVNPSSSSERYTLTATDQTFIYDDTGKLTKRQWSNGEEWTYSYYTSGYASGLLEKVEDGYGRELRFAYIDNSTGFDHLQLWRVGDQTASGLDSGSPSGRYVEFSYVENKMEDTGNPGTVIAGGSPLLETVQDVRGYTWTYAYEQADLDTLNYLTQFVSPSVDADGDGSPDSAITLKELAYTRSGGVMQSINQKLGKQGTESFLMEEDFNFNVDGEDKTTVIVAGVTAIHYFNYGMLVATEDNSGNSNAQAHTGSYRPLETQDANGNITGLAWSEEGKQLLSVKDAQANETQFSYDSQDRLIASTDAEGRVTNYVYDADRRQPSQILITDAALSDLAVDGDMEDNNGDWIAVGTPTTSQQSQTEVSDGDHSWHMNGAAGEGIESAAAINFAANTTYIITARVYVVNGQVKIGVEGDSNWDVAPSETGEWETLRALHTPGSAVSAQLQFLADGGAAEFYVDSVHVLAVSALQRWQQFVYDDKGRTLEEYLLDHEDAQALQSTVRAYGTSGNGNGLLTSIEIKDLLDPGNDSTTQYDYDAQGRVIRTHKLSMFGSCEYNHTVYDEAGNVLGTACGLVLASPIPDSVADLLDLYDVNDNQKKHTRITTHSYDEMGRRVQTTSNAGTSFARSNRTIYDALGRVVRTIQNYVVQGSSAPGDWVWSETNQRWEYSASDSTPVSHGSDLDENIISDTDTNARGLVYRRRDVLGRVMTLYGYNNADRLVKTIQNASDPDYDASYATGDPDLSAYVAGSGSDEDIITEQVYDPNGNVVKSIDARGSVTFTVYDALNRPVKVIANAAQPSYDILSDLNLSSYGDYSSDPDKDMVSTTDYDKLGRVIRSQRLLENRGATDNWDTTLYGYDSLGRQVRSIQHASDADYDMAADPDLNAYTLSTDTDVDMLTETVYDNQGRVKETIDVNERVTRMVYDGLNRQRMTVANYVESNPAVDPSLWEWDETNARWEDGSGNAIDHGSNKDQNIITETIYDSDGRVQSTRNAEGLMARNAYDVAGRSLLSIQNFVDNSYVDPAGTTTQDPWTWDAAQGRWEDGDGTEIARGSNFDQNLIMKPDYDDEHRIVQTRDAKGNLNRQVYDEAGRQVLSIANYVPQTDGSSNPVPPETWYWDTTNERWQGIADVSSAVIPIDHGSDNDQNRISETEYDLLGRGFRTRNPAGRETYTVYDALGRVIRRVQNYVQQASTIPDEWSWDETNAQYEYSAGNAVDTGSNNDQNIISETAYNQAGQVVSTRDAFGTQTSFVYDAAGRRLQVTQASNTPLASSNYTCFDKAGRTLRSIANYQPLYDDAQQLISPDAWDSNENWLFNPGEHGSYRDTNLISEMVYDRASRRVSSSNPAGDVSSTTYFKDGQVDSLTDPEGMVTVYRYDALRRRRLVAQSFVDNGEDPALWVWNGSQYTKSDTTTAIGHGTENDENIIVMVAHDIAGRMVSLRDPRGNLTTYDYDKLGRRSKLTNPLNIDWITAYAEVNGANQTTMTYPGINGGTSYDVVRDFDRMGRLQQIDYNDAVNTPKVNFAYDILGNRVNMSENDGTSDIRITSLSYDNLNRLTQVDFDTDGDSMVEETVSYEYDIRGLRTKLTMPGNLSISYSYDAKGRLIALNDWDDQQSDFHYDALNRHRVTRRPNGMRSIYKVDEGGRLRELRHENSARETLASFRYRVDGRGNRTQAQELKLEPNATLATDIIQHDDTEVVYTGTWTNNAGFHESSQWDARMKLTFVGDENVELVLGEGPDHSIVDVYVDGTLYQSVDAYAASAASRTVNISLKGDGFHNLELRNRRVKNLQSSGYKVRFQSLSSDTKLTWDTIDYSYDALSRLIEADYNFGDTVYSYGYDEAGNLVNYDGVTRIYNTANQMTNDGTNTLTYDNNGNLRTVGSDTYSWDRANRLLSVGNHSYKYDGLSNRVQQTVNTVVTDYLNDLQPGLTKLLKQTTGTNVEHFVHAPRGIHAIDDGIDWNFYANDGLGSVRAVVDDMAVVQQAHTYDPYGNYIGTAPAGSYIGYTGEQTDGNGQVYLRARYYDPAFGSFIKRDHAETANRYAYVNGNPINLVDPTGLLAMERALPSDFSRTISRSLRRNPFLVSRFNASLCSDNATTTVLDTGKGITSFYKEDPGGGVIVPTTSTVLANSSPAVIQAFDASVVISDGRWDSDCPDPNKCCESSIDVCNTTVWGGSNSLGTISIDPAIGVWTHTHFGSSRLFGGFEQGVFATPRQNRNYLRNGSDLDWMQFQGKTGRLTIPLSSIDFNASYSSSSSRGAMLITSPFITDAELNRIGIPIRANVNAKNQLEDGDISINEVFIQAVINGNPEIRPDLVNPSSQTDRRNFLFYSRRINSMITEDGSVLYEFYDDVAERGDSGGGIFRVENGQSTLVGVHQGFSPDRFAPLG